jgi:uncharacterized membrane protein
MTDLGENKMSELVVVTYPDVYRAGEVCAAIQRLHDAFLIDIEDIAYITREENGKVKLHETANVTTAAAGLGFVRGTIWGGLVGLLFLNPVLGMVAGGAIGAAGGAATGKMIDYGITTSFMKDIGERVVPGTSALFILFRKANWEKVIDRIAEYGGVVMHSSLSAEAEAKLQSALAESEPKAA